MSSPSANSNPFARFALGAAAGDGGRRDVSSFNRAPARPVDSSPAKKIRTAFDEKPGDRQEPPKGLQEKYRYERALVLVPYSVPYDRPDYRGRTLPSSFSATIVETRERTTTLIQQYHPHSARGRTELGAAPTGSRSDFALVLCSAIGRGGF